jgi:predicted nuclease of predicted toxin-antitoxin system
LDHNLPHKLRTSLTATSKHEIVTTSYLGWAELKNGELLRTAEENGLEVFVTGDKSLMDEQNFARCRLAIVALSANNWRSSRTTYHGFLPRLIEPPPILFQALDCGRFSRKKSADL